MLPATESIPWDPNADFSDRDFFWNVIDLAWGCLELPNGHVKRIWQQDLAVIVDLYELENNGIPRTYHEAWSNYYYNVGGDPGITVKWSAVKNFVKNPDDYGFDDDCGGRANFGCEPYLYDVDIIFADGSSLHYDNGFIEK